VSTHGIILGKFMPPHLGHLYLVDFARHYADEVTVVVGSLACEPISGELRFAWMRELCPGLRVVHLTDENPQQPDQHPDFWNIWKRSLERVVERPIDLVFASEDYGQPLAEVLGARFIPANGLRSLVPISGTQVRQNPAACWAYLPAPVRAHYVRRVSVFGPESTGKSSLAARLAAHYQTLWVPEFARAWLEARGGQVRLEDMAVISRAQRASEEALARQSGPLLFCDTDPSATPLWSQELFSQSGPELEVAVGAYALTLLCAPDVPWVEDSVRYRPEGGQAFWERCRARLSAEGRLVVELNGDWERRWQQAREAVDQLLK
jgi:HTH-type transcriptional repressor of NAD biosynthesis genes